VDHSEPSPALSPSSDSRGVMLPLATWLAREQVQQTLEATLASVTSDGDEVTASVADEYLVFWVRGKRFAAPLKELREALPTSPALVALPFSPTWFLGLFAYRAEIVALIDLATMLESGPSDDAPDVDATSWRDTAPPDTSDMPFSESRCALVMGQGERLIAIQIDRLGDIAPLSADALLPDVGNRTGDVVDRYVIGALRLGDGQDDARDLNLGALLEDILSSLEERAHYA
jgi:chemotaxis signal transduction protein